MEYFECLRSGGNGFMCCLTYSPDLVPRIEIDGKSYMVFNKKHVIDFIKRLRTNLDRFYLKHFNKPAPDFKYLVTSEYGSDPTKRHQPHYHFIFTFRQAMPHYYFRQAFNESIYLRRGKSKKRVFGYIYQCDLIDPSKGGLRYSGKYVCKDIMFEPTRLRILDKIKFAKEDVNSRFNIVPCPSSLDEELRNKCIRSTKAYRKAVADCVRPYSHMLQFYMLSNDLGISASIKQYGESILSLPSFSFEGFPFAIPKLVKERVRQTYGDTKANELTKRIFIGYVERVFNELVPAGNITRSEADDLILFAKTYIKPAGSSLYLVNPEGFDFALHHYAGSLVDWDTIICEFQNFYNNGFFALRNRLMYCLALYNTKDRLNFRASVAHKKTMDEKEKYEQKKRNKSYKYA